VVSSAHLFLAGENVLAASAHRLKYDRSISINVTEWFPRVNAIGHKIGSWSFPQTGRRSDRGISIDEYVDIN
jgi:hypothetical protein